MRRYDIIIVGAGISGATLAERYANVFNKNVLVIEKRGHVGGNCYDSINEHGILVTQYGAHLFHTNYEDVWQYINSFSDWNHYEHRVLSHVDGQLVPVPVNIKTVNSIFGLNIQSSEEMNRWLKNNVQTFNQPKNSEESALSRVGPVLYEKLFKKYTKKQWDLWPHELDPSVMDRIPVRNNFDDRYFTDKYQGLPKHGYTKLFEEMLHHSKIEVLLNTDYETIKNNIAYNEKFFFTGPIDKFFNSKFGNLQYRSLRFEFQTYNQEYFQSNSVINYPNEHDFTRIVEYKYFSNIKSSQTTVSREYSSWHGEPFYPVPNKHNYQVYDLYKQEAFKLENENIFFVGRMANYKYFNMDQAFKNALDLFSRLGEK